MDAVIDKGIKSPGLPVVNAWMTGLARRSKCNESDDAIQNHAPIRAADHPAVQQLMSRGLLSDALCQQDVAQT